MRNFFLRPLLAFGLLFVVALPQSAIGANEAEVEAIIQKYIEGHPEVIVNSLQKFYDEKRKKDAKAKFEESLKNRENIKIGKAPTSGPADAPITLIEFSDFQCPYCAKASATLSKLREKYKGKLRVVFKHLPLGFHKKAPNAAKASMAAHEQGKFWPYRNLLLKKQGEWGNANEKPMFLKYARDMGMDVEKFKTDMEKPEYQKLVEEDMALAKSLKISGTPTFFVNGVRLRGAVPLAQFDKVITMLLNEKK